MQIENREMHTFVSDRPEQSGIKRTVWRKRADSVEMQSAQWKLIVLIGELCLRLRKRFVFDWWWRW